MNVKIRPLNDKIVVRVQEAKEKSEGGIYFPDTAREKPRQGEIVAVGPGRWSENTGSCGRLPMMVKVGDVVVFTQWSGSEVKELGDGFLIMTESDVLGIVEK